VQEHKVNVRYHLSVWNAIGAVAALIEVVRILRENMGGVWMFVITHKHPT
jgi:hypothetical protein